MQKKGFVAGKHIEMYHKSWKKNPHFVDMSKCFPGFKNHMMKYVL